MDTALEEILSNRINKSRRLGHVVSRVQQKLTVGDAVYNIISRKGMIGVDDCEGLHVCLPVYDEIISVFGGGTLLIKICDTYGIFSLKTKKMEVLPDFDSVIVYDEYQTIEVIKNGKHGLWDDRECRLVIPVEYEDVTVVAYYPYLWVRKSQILFDFIERATGQLMNVPDAIMAYESRDGMFVQYRQTGRVIAVNANGYVNVLALRRSVITAHGRKVLKNKKYKIKDIIDIYGNILKR